MSRKLSPVCGSPLVNEGKERVHISALSDQEDSHASSSTPPRLLVDGLELNGIEAASGLVNETPEDETQRQLDLERLRAQLERSQLNRSPQNLDKNNAANRPQSTSQDKSPDTAGSESPADVKSSQRSRRRVQWVGLSADDDSHDHEKRVERGLSTAVVQYPPNRPGHVSVSVPSTPQDELEEPVWPISENMSDGLRTPGFITPDGSRPATPEAVPSIPAGERDGLPLPSSKRGRTFTREAAKLVAVHKAKTAFLSKRSTGSHRRGLSSSSDISPSTTRGPSRSAPPNEHLSHEGLPAASTGRVGGGGGGVLSALLKLYDQPQSERSSQATLVPSGASTPSEPATPALGSRQDAVDHRAPEELAVPLSFANEVRRRGQAQLAGFFALNHNNGTATSHASQDAQRSDQSKTLRGKSGIANALHRSTAAFAGAASPSASTAVAASSRPSAQRSPHSLPDLPTLNSLAAVSSEASSELGSRMPSPERPFAHRRKTGSSLHLNQLAKVPEQLAKSGEKLARESLDPKRYYRESSVLKAAKSRENSPSTPGTPAYEHEENEKVPIRRRKKDKKRQDEIFITMHVAAILQRQDFILRFARALMMFGAPSHRLEYQLQQTAKVLQIECQVIYIVNFMIISFSDVETHTSEIRFIKQASGLDLTKLTEIAILHWEVVHDKIGVEEASTEISNLMRARATYRNWQLVVFGTFASIMIGIAAFNASFIDLLVAAPLGALLVATQCFIAARSDVLSSIFEIVIAAIISFVAAAVASTTRFCYASITSSAIVLILPGWPTCIAALELQSRSLVSGSVRIVYAVVYSLFLGFGISLGANVWQLVSSQEVYTSNDNVCSGSHPPGAAWYQQTIPAWFYFLAVPGFPLCLSLRNHARPNKELLAMVIIAGIGWTANHFSTFGFPGRSDISSALGAFTVGILSNIYGKMFQSTAFIVAATPIMFQLPSGLANGGLLNWATTNANDQVVFSSGWSVAQQLISVVIGLVVGLLFACAVIYPFGKRRGGLMTF